MGETTRWWLTAGVMGVLSLGLTVTDRISESTDCVAYVSFLSDLSTSHPDTEVQQLFVGDRRS